MELEFIEWLQRRLPANDAVSIGPGDDAAVLDWSQSPGCVVTSDLLVDGVHFRIDADSPERIGHKSLAVNLSDLAAMAAQPVAAFVSLALPRDAGLPLAKRLIEGMLPLAERHGAAIAGGDTNVGDGPLVISITAIGRETGSGILRRDGGQPGDWLLVSGSLGGSILGRHLDFEPRVDEALRLNEAFRLHAGIDISDGLALDLSRLAQASHCGAILEASEIPVSEAARKIAAAGDSSKSALDHALADGEDFELLLAVPPEAGEQIVAAQPLGVPLRRVGELAAEPGLRLRRETGPMETLEPRGFEHR